MKMERVESVVKGRHVYYEIEVNDGDVLKCGLEQFKKGLAVTVEKSGRIAGHVPAHLQWGFRELILKGVKITCTILGDDYVQEPQFQKGKGVQQTCVQYRGSTAADQKGRESKRTTIPSRQNECRTLIPMENWEPHHCYS